MHVLENSDCDKNTENVITGNLDDKELTHLTLTRMADEDYYNGIEGLNTQQKTAFELVQSYFKTLADFNDGLINTKPEPVHIYISGPGGTGKSHLIRMIREMIIRSSLKNSTSQSPAVVVVAPTGIAAYNIEGITIHRALNLPVQHGSCPKYVPLKGERLSAMRKQWVYTNTIIIDEISIVSYETFVMIHQRLNDIKNVSCDSFFGGLNVIALGDLYQLPPVPPGHFVSSGKSQLNTHPWKDLFTMLELEQNMRQKDDIQYGNLLLRIRTSTHTNDDSSILRSRIKPSIECNLEPYSSALHLFPTVKKCEVHNMFKLSQLAKFTAMYCIKAHHSIVDFKKNQKNTSDQSFITNLIPADDRECAGLPNQLHLCVGAVVMLRRNIYTADGLVNGVRGSIVGFEWKNGIAPINPLDGYMPEQILISFFDSKVGQLAKAETNFTYVPICPVTAEFHGKYGSVLARTQFPLSLSWAATIHKVQGLTLSNAVIDIGNDVFSPGMSYVTLSRVKSLNGLALLSLNVGAIHCSPEVEEEMIKNSHENLNENENVLEE